MDSEGLRKLEGDVGAALGGAAGRAIGEFTGVPGGGEAGQALGSAAGRTVAETLYGQDPEAMREHFGRRCGR